MTLRKITLIIVLDMFQKVNKQKKKIINQKQQKLVLFHVNRTKKFHKTVKKFLKNVAASGFTILK